MNTVRFIGDVHGRFNRYYDIIKDVCFSIQVGDMGVGFPYGFGGLSAPNVNGYDVSHLFIRGNHDNPAHCENVEGYIADGTMIDGVFCLGGASSIDKRWRTEGVDWWPDEECSIAELERHIDRYAHHKPEIVVTHECPEQIADVALALLGRRRYDDDASRTRQALQRMFEIHQPREWYFGHWHTSFTHRVGNTKFRCLNELEFCDVELG